MVRSRLTIGAFAIAAVVAISGCGGGGSSDPTAADLAVPGSVVYLEAKLNPPASLKADVNSLAQAVAGINDLGGYIANKLESSAREKGDTLDFSSEVEPWLGSDAGIAFKRLVDGDLAEPLIAVATTNPEATAKFVNEHAGQGTESFRDATYEGIQFKVGGSENSAIGVIDQFLVIADGQKQFEAAVDAQQGDSLADEDRFEQTISAASEGSIADIYVDVGKLIGQGEGEIDPQAGQVLESSGIDPSEATAVASLLPGPEQLEIDVSSDLGDEEAPSGDASKLLGTLPASSAAAFATTDFGDQLKEAIDNLDETGVPPQLKPNQLKSTLSAAGIDLDEIAASIEEAAVFAEGTGRDDLGGALVLTTSSEQTAKAVASLGTLLRTSRVPGVTAVSGQASGFSIRSKKLGPKPVVIIANGERIAVGYGLAQALEGVNGESGATLDGSATYKAAVSSLDGTPISAFADGPAALRLAEALVPRSNTDFWEVQPYLKNVDYVAIGTGREDDFATARIIAGVGK
jgi:Protein of unknown function (DUF3352)